MNNFFGFGSKNDDNSNSFPYLGIDLGTTNTVVSSKKIKSKPEILQTETGSRLLPSVVHFLEKNTVVGSQAKEKFYSDPLNTYYSTKRLMGLEYALSLKVLIISDLTSSLFSCQIPKPNSKIREGTKNIVNQK